jgi:outer membrane lipoprotein SlyB
VEFEMAKIHPWVLTGALALLAMTALGVGITTGRIPNSFSKEETIADRGMIAVEEKSVDKMREAEQKVLDPTKSETTQRVRAEPTAKTAVPAKAVDRQKVTAVERAPLAKTCENCGVVTAVEEVKEQGEGTGIGALGGGVAGAVIGNQVGRGTTRKIATIAGAAAGAYGGHQAEKYIRGTIRYDVTVRMDDGTYRTISEKTNPALQPGDKVKVEGDSLVRN